MKAIPLILVLLVLSSTATGYAHYIHTNNVAVELYEAPHLPIVRFEMTGRNLLPYPVEGYMDWHHRVFVQLDGPGESTVYQGVPFRVLRYGTNLSHNEYLQTGSVVYLSEHRTKMHVALKGGIDRSPPWLGHCNGDHMITARHQAIIDGPVHELYLQVAEDRWNKRDTHALSAETVPRSSDNIPVAHIAASYLESKYRQHWRDDRLDYWGFVLFGVQPYPINRYRPDELAVARQWAANMR